MTILDALRQRHARDVLIEECNLGSAHAGCRRLDAWVLLKTWSPWTTVAYEIKSDRSDFLRDRKWPEYLPVCHELYFVSPAKLIAPEELPADIGLLWTTSGSRLVTKRRAVRRQPEPAALNRLMSYALMSRAQIVADMYQANRTPESRAEQWRRILQQKDADRELGHLVSRRVRQALRAADDRARQAERRAEDAEAIRRRLDALGLGDVMHAWDLEQRVGTAGIKEIQRLAENIARLAGNVLARNPKAGATA